MFDSWRGLKSSVPLADPEILVFLEQQEEKGDDR